MFEPIRSRRWSQLGYLVTAIVLAAVGTSIVRGAPFEGQKNRLLGGSKSKSSAAQADKAGSDSASSRATPSAVGAVVAKVNGEEITYKALAEEVIARKGPEVLETMISRKLVEQACRERGIKVTAQEIHDEIGRTAQRLGMGREQYIKLLKNERGMSYEQYENDIVWPALALKKMATPFVKVTEEDIRKGFEAYYGEKVRCRWIMVNDLQSAMRIWNELKETAQQGKVPLAEFERQVTLWSVDPGTRSLGGQLQPISRHTGPSFKAVEEGAFALREDGEMSKVIQLGDAYVILYREQRIPPKDVKLEAVRDQIESDIYEAKTRDRIAQVFQDLQKNATIENLLTGEVSTPEKDDVVPVEKVEKPAVKPATKTEATKKGAAAPKK